jgi:hypothetical protein
MVERPHIDRSTYKYVDQLSRPGFAWEFLRRNSDYRRDWQVHRTSVPRRHVSSQGIEFSFLRRRFTQAESWGLRAFEDPTADGRSARLFWLPNVLARSIQGRALLDQTEGGGSGRRLAITDIAGTRAVLVDADGVVHVSIDSDLSNVGLSISNLRQPFGTFALVFEIPAFDAVKRRFDAILDLEWRVNRPLAQSGGSNSDGHFRTKLIHCLIAVDGRRHGLSYRDLAQVLFGTEAVAKDWSGPSRFLKERMRRLVERGESLVNGGYRDLLR